MDICFRLLHNHAARTSSSWFYHILLYSIFTIWTVVEGWSYHHSPKIMNWDNARTWCRKNYTDMVAIQNREEISHLNDILPKKPNYYWIGIRKVASVWTWVGTNKTLTAEAENWAGGEPNNGGNNEDCVEIYIKRDKDAGKWNDESCGKEKTALCYTASCKSNSCNHGVCVETINSHKCECFEGFYGNQCEKVIQCKMEEVTVPDKASVSCSHPNGNFSFNSTCQYFCEEGYQLNNSGNMKCTASQSWSGQPPTCELLQCSKLYEPMMGSMACYHPLGSFSYLSTCVFTCKEGYEMVNSSPVLQCGASGQWNTSLPQCVAVSCPSLQKPQDGAITCDEDFTYGSSCRFSCSEGYRLQGASKVICTSAAKWSEKIPHCEAIKCLEPEKRVHLLTECSHAPNVLWPNSTCSFSCAAGFHLLGAPNTKCTEMGQWSTDMPTCTAIQCPSPVAPHGGQVSCEDPSHSWGSSCAFRCDEGFNHQGASSMKCSGSGEWSADFPICTAIQCPSPVAPHGGQVSCEDLSHSWGSSCTFSCDEGFNTQGASSMKCSGSGEWSADIPTCTVLECPLLQAPVNGQMSCFHESSDATTYGSECSFFCDQGYILHGHEAIICDLYGNWTGEVAVCQASPGPLLRPTTMELAAIGAVSLSGISLAAWFLKRLRRKANKFHLDSTSDIEEPPQTYKSSIDSLI
ncbi:E-selectin [Esox lucius]|uniref:E-selectin n=1 Tax=Esox lucius TaxID=8010 RepID=A0A3P9AGJ1_ESOLU|nr:E-selectin [Esox lucius]